MLAKYVKFNQNQATSSIRIPLDSRESTALLVDGETTPSQPLASGGLQTVARLQRNRRRNPLKPAPPGRHLIEKSALTENRTGEREESS